MLIEVTKSGFELNEAKIQELFLDGDTLSISFIILLPLFSSAIIRRDTGCLVWFYL